MILPGATYEPVPSIDDGLLVPNGGAAIVLHTCVCSDADLHDYWASGDAGAGVGAHLYVDSKGKLYQYLDTTRKTGHAFAANAFAVGLESYDGGNDPPGAWSAAQLATIIAACVALGVPARTLPEDGKGGGVGYHKQYDSWNVDGHSCPGVARIAQVPLVIGGITVAKGDADKLAGEFYIDAATGRGLAAVANFLSGVREQYRNVYEGESFTPPTGTDGASKDVRAGFNFAKDLQAAASS